MGFSGVRILVEVFQHLAKLTSIYARFRSIDFRGCAVEAAETLLQLKTDRPGEDRLLFFRDLRLSDDFPQFGNYNQRSL